MEARGIEPDLNNFKNNEARDEHSVLKSLFWQKTRTDPSPVIADHRGLPELMELWYQMHGQHLKDGMSRKRKLLALVESMDNPIGSGMRPDHYLNYRQRHTAAGINAKTLNNELGYINAVFNELRRTQQVAYENPLASVRPIKLRERELSFLTLEQIRELLETIERTSDNPHVLLITKLCFATGCHWGEVEKLHVRQIERVFTSCV